MPLFFNILALLSVGLLSWLYWLGIEQSYFWVYSWYDILLHLLGGLTIGLWAMAVSSRVRLSAVSALLLAAVLILPVLVAWEVWEYAVGLTGNAPDYWEDTLLDIVCGAAGALVAWAAYSLAARRV